MIRKTRQRDAVLSVFRSKERPLTPKEVLSLAIKQAPSLGLTTVYRHIRALEKSGDITVVDYPGQPLRFELASKEYRPHFICNVCRKLYYFSGYVPQIEFIPPAGFEITGQEVVFYGICRECKAKETKKKKD